MPASAMPMAMRSEPRLSSPKSTAAPNHDSNAESVSASGRLKSSLRWRSVGGVPSRAQMTARRSSIAFTGRAITPISPT